MPVICFFLPCLGWLSFCRFLHCKSLMNLALMFSFINQIHQVPSAPLYLSCSKINCLYCFPAIWHHLFWDLRTWLICTLAGILVLCFTVLPQEWAWGLGFFAAVSILGPLLFFPFAIWPFSRSLFWVHFMTYSHTQWLESAFTKFNPRGLYWLCFQLVKVILDHKDPRLHVLLPSFPCAFSLALFTGG